MDYSDGASIVPALSLTVLLPMRNEEKFAESKINSVIEEIANFKETRLVVVTSSSDDGTREIALNTLSSSILPTSRWEVADSEIPGKTRAVNLGLSIIETDLVMMMDADASTKSRTIGQLVSWFQDPIVGGVCGCISEAILGEKGYRNRFNKLRFSESIIDSTPIFEGSVCAFRIEAIGKSGIDPSINAKH